MTLSFPALVAGSLWEAPEQACAELDSVSGERTIFYLCAELK